MSNKVLLLILIAVPAAMFMVACAIDRIQLAALAVVAMCGAGILFALILMAQRGSMP